MASKYVNSVPLVSTRTPGCTRRVARRASSAFTAWFALLRLEAGAALAVILVLLLATAQPAFGVVLGEIELRSSLGQPLRARIPYTLEPGERIDAACVRLEPGTRSAAADIPAFVTAEATLRAQAGKNYIVLESARPINQLMVRLIVDVRCGPSVRTTREYVLLPDEPEKFTGRMAPRLDLASSAGPIASSPAANLFQIPASPRVESPPVRVKASDVAAVPLEKSAGVPNPSRQRPSRERIEPAFVDADAAAPVAGNSCCFRFSYELADRGPPPSEVERERLRQEMRDPASRLQALRDEADSLKGQLASTASRLAGAEALSQQQARTAREFVFYGVLAAIVVVSCLGAWLWSTMRRRRKPDVPGKIDSYTVSAGERDFDRSGAPAATVIPILTKPEARPATPPADTRRPGPPARIDFDVSPGVPDVQFAPDVTLPAHIANPLDPAFRAAEYKKAYILGRFPEIAAGNLVLRNSASVIEGARIFYQDDHNPAKAVELLRIALASHPHHVHLWLALFEILSLESMAPEFADLAQRYHETHDVRADNHWPRVAKLGRVLEPGNKLYRADGLLPAEGSNPNWLNSELDMMGDTLALELRKQVLESHDANGSATSDVRG